MWSLLRSALPEGRLLTPEVFTRRHAWIVQLCAWQALLLTLLIATLGRGWWQALLGGAVIGLPGLVAWAPRFSRGLRTAAASTSLTVSAVVLVHTFPGVGETHFHFFVMVAVVALYQDWTAFGVALVIVVAHHALLGTIDTNTVFGHHHGQPGAPLFWALVHGGFVLAASCAHLASWRLNEQQSLHDPLTGLANRLLLTEHLHRALARSAPVSVLYLDLDDFKDVNDGRGHATGDQVLCIAGERMRSAAGPADVVARLGGDEFAVVHAGDADSARALGERILTALAVPTVVTGRALTLHASIGVAGATTERRVDTVLRDADLAMYEAKRTGKARVAVYDEGLSVAARAHAELAEDLAVALAAGNQLEVHYQDIVALPGGRPVGQEALLRWRHPTRGPVSPVEFVPLAEDSGAIVGMGTWVLQQATAHAVAVSAALGAPSSVSVNVSVRQLRESDFADVVTAALASSGLPARQLVLEITESLLVTDLRTVLEPLHQLRELGVRVAIDDFGTGYSSLSYLRRLPVDRIKIDRSFVADLDTGGPATTLVSTIIELARGLGLDVVAEGVETEQQRAQLVDLHCTHAQGYLFGRPAPAASELELNQERQTSSAPHPRPRQDAAGIAQDVGPPCCTASLGSTTRSGG